MPTMRSRCRRFVLLGSLVVLGGSLHGCSVHNDPHYNPYARPAGDPTVLESADHAADFLSDSLDNLDSRIENSVY